MQVLNHRARFGSTLARRASEHPSLARRANVRTSYGIVHGDIGVGSTPNPILSAPLPNAQRVGSQARCSISAAASTRSGVVNPSVYVP